MKRIFYLFAISALLCGCAPFNLLNSQVKFAQISVADFFKNDTIRLKIADSMIFDNIVVTSDPCSGHTGLEVELVKYKNNLFRIFVQGPDRTMDFVWCKQTVPKKLKVEVWLNGKYKLYKFNLNKGIYILIDKHEGEISPTQTNMIPKFE